MKLFIVLLLAYGAWASKGSSNSSVFLRYLGSSRCGSVCGDERTWYWKNYKGKVPRDAIDAGDCKHPSSLGNLFVGQGYDNSALLPGSLRPGIRSIQVYQRVTVSNVYDNIMILCTKDKVNIHWIEVNIKQVDSMKNIPGMILIDGGFEFFVGMKIKLYIGRHVDEGNMQEASTYIKELKTNIKLEPFDDTSYYNDDNILYYCESAGNAEDYETKVKCEIIKEIEISETFDKIKEEPNEQGFVCHICNAKFTKKSYMRRHLGETHSTKLFSCEVCDTKFPRKISLKKHLKIHTKEKLNVCNICDKSYSYKDSLAIHLRTHTKEKPFPCNLCKWKFSTKNNLRAHLKLHNGEKSFKCKICNRNFAKKCTLDRHLRIHTGEKPYVCNVCNNRFSRKYTLKSHEQLHW